MKFTDYLKNNKDMLGLVEELTRGGVPIPVKTPSRFRPFLISCLHDIFRTGFIVLTKDRSAAENLAINIRFFGRMCEVFPEWGTLPHEKISPDPLTVAQRMRAIDTLNSGGIAVATVRSAMLPAPNSLDEKFRPLVIQKNMHISMDDLTAKLIDLGYERVVTVENAGDIAVRGGIIDIYSPLEEHPCRLEFFGNTVESVRTFDVISQRSVKKIDDIKIYAVREVHLDDEKASRAVKMLQPQSEQMKWLEEDIQMLEQQQYFDGIEVYLPFLEKKIYSLFDYLKRGTIIIDEGTEITSIYEDNLEKETQYIREIEESGLVPKAPVFYLNDIAGYLGENKRNNNVLSLNSFKAEVETTAGFNAGPSFSGPLSQNRIKSFVGGLLSDGFRIIIVLHDTGTANRTSELLEEVGFSPQKNPQLSLTVGELNEGFVADWLKIAFVSQDELFGHMRSPREVKSYGYSAGRAISRLSELHAGDYIVHKTHGIGLFKGLSKRIIDDTLSEYLEIEYLAGDRLFVPVNSLDRVLKYGAVGEEAPRLTKLGSVEWYKTKQRVKRSLRKVAVNLTQLYSQRMKIEGYTFPSDQPWQKELEDAFPYEETSDQAKAIDDVKTDMQSHRPMDRLVCGDVGFGKTEVAIRAAFKVVLEGKQVMILVPTTLLARQHFKTFGERMSPFPVRVELLSRLLKKPKQKEIVDALNGGSVDIIIGTHRLLQKDIKPIDLGLIIIDEEHRFGVSHKEKLRAMKESADVLTLTATPIPRTLQMSLSGIRDLSIMETPPPGRRPINTYAGVFDPLLVKTAIRRELSREGQVFYVHNRVEDIFRVKAFVDNLVPEAKSGVVHGQMKEGGIEEVMSDFLERKIDILISTSIIESGIDIPNANTLIIDDAENFGLAQLYQIRGRIGRSFERGYAYLFVKSRRGLQKTAGQRLKTLAELTALGSGLKIALKDLEIRGAGTLLGGEQHGHIAAVGFDMYADLLSESVKELKGEPVKKESEATVTLPVNAFIPESYIAEEELRIEIYRNLADVSEPDDAKDVLSSLNDRFGPVPEEVLNLVKICSLKSKAERYGLEKISYSRERLQFYPVDTDLAEKIAAGYKRASKYNRIENALYVSAKETEILKIFEKVIEILYSYEHE